MYPKIEMMIKCFQNRFICRLAECDQLVKNLDPAHRVTFKFYF